MSQNTLRFSSNSASPHAAKVRVHSLIGMSGNLSVGKYVVSDSPILDSLLVSYHHRQIREGLSVNWKAPSAPWLKGNTDGSIIGNYGACGGLFRDHLGSFLDAFTSNLGTCSVFTPEVHAFILPLDATQHGWMNLWLESESTNALLVLKNPSLLQVLLQNRWKNARSLGIPVISSHIFREGNCCADQLASLGNSTQDEVWFSILAPKLREDFYLDLCGMPRFRFPMAAVLSLFVFSFSWRVLAYSPLPFFFPPFF